MKFRTLVLRRNLRSKLPVSAAKGCENIEEISSIVTFHNVSENNDEFSSALLWNAHVNSDDSFRCLDLGLDDLSIDRHFEEQPLRCAQITTKHVVYLKPQKVDTGKDTYERHI